MFISIVKNSILHDTRVLKIANSMYKKGYKTQVLGLEDGRDISGKQIPVFHIQILKLKTKNLGKNLFFQLIKYLEWTYKVIKSLKNENISYIHCNDLAPLLICVLLKKIHGAKLVYDAHELETETHQLIKSKFRKKLSKLIERALIQKVDGVITVSNSIKSWYENEYNINDVRVIRNIPLREEYFYDNEVPNELIFSYVGAFREGKGVTELLSIFSQLPKSNIRFMGEGPLLNNILRSSKSYDNICYKKNVPPNQVINAIRDCSIGFVFTRDTCLSRKYSLPNKLFQYLYSNIPVIVSDLPDMKNLILKYDVGWVVSDERQLIELISKLDKKEIALKRHNVKNFINDVYWEKESTQLNIIYDK